MYQWLAVFLCVFVITGCASQEKLRSSVKDSDLQTAQEMVDAGMNPYEVNESGESAVSLGLTADEGSSIQQWAFTLSKANFHRALTLWENLQSDSPMSVAAFQAEINKADFYIDTALTGRKTTLFWLVSDMNGMDAYAKVLLDHGADIDFPEINGWTPLLNAVYDGDVSITKLLISGGASLNKQQENGPTALHYLSGNTENGNREHDTELAELLLSAGADPNIQHSNKATPLFIATVNNRLDVMRVLIQRGADPDSKAQEGITPLMAAVHNGNVDAAQILLEAGANIGATDKLGWTALHFAADSAQSGKRSHDVELARLLIAAGANTDTRIYHHADFNSDDTPMLMAIKNRRHRLMKVLIEADNDINLSDRTGMTPLMEAVSARNIIATKALINAGADLSLINEAGWSALHFAADTVNPAREVASSELVQLLTDSGADINARNSRGATALYIAVAERNVEARGMLLKLGANPDIAIPENADRAPSWSPLILAVNNSDLDSVKALIEAGANLDHRDHAGWTALAIAGGHPWDYQENDSAIAKVLIEAGANLHALSKRGRVPPLGIAVINAKPSVVKVLLEAGADPNFPQGNNPNNYMALHVAASKGFHEIAKMLLEAGADVDARNYAGETPTDLARRNEHRSVLKQISHFQGS